MCLGIPSATWCGKFRALCIVVELRSRIRNINTDGWVFYDDPEEEDNEWDDGGVVACAYGIVGIGPGGC